MFLMIEIITVILIPLSILPTIISCINTLWPKWYTNFTNKKCPSFASQGTPCFWADIIDIHDYENIILSSFTVAATFITLGLNLAFFSYIITAAVADKIHGRNFLPTYPGESCLCTPEKPKGWNPLGSRRTSPERVAVLKHCTEYIFKHSVFRKHAYVLTSQILII